MSVVWLWLWNATILLNDILVLFPPSGAQHSLPIETTAYSPGALHSVIGGRQRRRRPAESVGPQADTCPVSHRKVHEGRLRSVWRRHTTNRQSHKLDKLDKLVAPSLGLDPATQGELNLLPRPSPPRPKARRAEGGDRQSWSRLSRLGAIVYLACPGPALNAHQPRT